MEQNKDVAAANALADIHRKLRQEIAKVIVGQEEVIDQVLLSLYCNGHSLLVGVPGLAKTLLIKTISEALDLSFNRIQFTPDLMPSDIIGSEILDEQRQFKFIKGPLFAHIILADEINRTPPKTQAALLEAMQEKNVTAAGQLHALPKPFFVLATQNPIEQEGTYPLPEAQLDRFMFHIVLDYPSFEEEVAVVKSTTGYESEKVNKVLNEQSLLEFQSLIRKVPVSDNVVEYAVRLVSKTRPNTQGATQKINDFLAYGAGPRASQNLIMAAKGHALMHGKFSPDIENVQAVAEPILRHRIVRNYKAEAEGISVEEIIRSLY
ncbi:MAG: MoxR family ATPase [Bacteroidota bacterium]|nr:MoxR family ATPase [Bacteroidota bacterium]MDX5429686.1 MoxR family ATPase [Bacteroidota bacterium]MDX5468467.1 MoxR family ATPase [Bacteroidota bacterium]